MLYSGLAALAFASSVSAHTRMYSVWVNGVDQGDGRGVYIRSPPNNNPVKDITSADIACNAAGSTAVSHFVSIAAGDSVSFEWYHDTRGDDIIASSHKGPIITYIAPYTDGMDGTGAIWSKINEEGYDASTDTWAVDNLISNAGKKDFTLPSTLAAGQYMIRQEVIGLHEADVSYASNSARGAQFYPSCVQVEVTGSGSATPDEAFELPGGYTYSDAGIVFSIYGSFTSYPIPGPDVWSSSDNGSGSAATTSPTVAATTSAVVTTSAAATTTAVATTSAAAVTPTTLATSVKASSSSVAVATSSSAPSASASASPSKKPCSKKRRSVRKH
ncbi:glycosyl hydrolase family 61-domain-containing protein [Xylariales sp. AK1849]|nr:glycosyl hydrolase family 61-domain-containing protein [Xylariales sp. AK1849]